MNSLLATGNDLFGKRAGAASREATGLHRHQQWFAHYYLREDPHCKNRPEVEERIERLVNAITDGVIAEIEEEQFP